MITQRILLSVVLIIALGAVGFLFFKPQSNTDITPNINPEPTGKIATGYVTGHVDIGPFCPVEIVGEPCKVPPEAYSSREVIVYESNQTTINVKGKIDTNGNYKIALGPGKYYVQIRPAGIGEGEKKLVIIKSFETSTLNFDIDTGIR